MKSWIVPRRSVCCRPVVLLALGGLLLPSGVALHLAPYELEPVPRALTATILGLGLDRDADALTALAAQARVRQLPLHGVRADLAEMVKVAEGAQRTGLTPQFSTTGGTSDGRFIAPTGAQVVEVGVGNATIHKVNECVRVEDVDTLSLAYERIMELLLT